MNQLLPPGGGRPPFFPPEPYEPVIGSRAPDAITLGRLILRKEDVVERVCYGGDQHVMVFGPNGKGKGTRLLVPNLLRMSGCSMIVIDPKGELAAVTAPYRRTLGKVVIINPFGLLTDIPGYADLRSTGFNPLARVDPSLDSFNYVVAQLASAAMMTMETKEAYFNESARALLSSLIMQEILDARDEHRVPTFANVRDMLCQPSEWPHAGNNFEGAGLYKIVHRMMKSGHIGLRHKAAQFQNETKDILAIISTARVHTEYLDDVEIVNDLALPHFDMADIKREPVTVYLILPPEQMQRHAPWLRLLITSAILASLRPRRHGEPKVVFMLDEFFTLGSLEILSTVWSLVRGYGIQMMPVLQDLPMLKKNYPNMWETFIGMAGVISSFSPNDHTTAEWMSERAGELSRKTTSHNSTYSESKNHGTGSGPSGGTSNSGKSESFSSTTTISEAKSRLITPHKLRGLRPGFMMTTIDGVANGNALPIYAPAYYDVQSLAARARDNPYFSR